MYAALTLAALLSAPAISSASPVSPPIGHAQRAGSISIPLKHLSSRQHSPVLAERQQWLRSQARTLRRKYAHHLDDRDKDLLERDFELERREIAKRADSGVVQCV